MFCSPAEARRRPGSWPPGDNKMRELGLTGPKVRGAAVRTRPRGSFEVFAPSLDVERGRSPTWSWPPWRRMRWPGSPRPQRCISVAQIQDTESGAEIMHMAENGFCADGEQERMLADGETRIGGRLPVNTDGGCLACGRADRLLGPAPGL